MYGSVYTCLGLRLDRCTSEKCSLILFFFLVFYVYRS